MNVIIDLRENQSQEILLKMKEYFSMETKVISLQDEIHSCIGCWSCWLKTPGACAIKDTMEDFYSAYINSNKVILLLDTQQGFIDHTAKAFLDRTIPHYLPYIEIVDGECHHVARYEEYPELYFYYDIQNLTKDEEQVIEDYLYRTAYHFQSSAFRIQFGEEIIVKALKNREAKRATLRRVATEKMEKLIIYNGSPRRKGSNTGSILEEVKQSIGSLVEIRDLKDMSQWVEWTKAFEKEENVLFIMPLYVHAMPSHVMDFFEGLTPSKGTLSFIIQSGFPESSQSYFLEAYFEQLSKRLKRKYLGTAIKGGVEGLQVRPPKSQKKIIAPFVLLIEGLVYEGRMDQNLLNKLAKPIHLPNRMLVLFFIMEKIGLINIFWNKQLKDNKCFEKRFAKPYKQKLT